MEKNSSRRTVMPFLKRKTVQKPPLPSEFAAVPYSQATESELTSPQVDHAESNVQKNLHYREIERHLQNLPFH